MIADNNTERKSKQKPEQSDWLCETTWIHKHTHTNRCSLNNKYINKTKNYLWVYHYEP